MTQPSVPTPPARGDRPIWAYLLIAAGVVLLLANAGWFDFGILWSALSLWPIALIALGADLLTGGRFRLPIVGVALVVAVAWWAVGLRGGGVGGERLEVAVPLDGARSGAVVLRMGVAETTLDAAAPSGSLLSGTIVVGRGETVVQRPSRAGDTARVEVLSEQVGPASITGSDPRRWTLSVSRTVPIDLRVQSGVGRTTLDLRAATLSRLDYAAGVGETTVTLPDRGGYRGSLELGVGATTVRLPERVEARITVRTGLGNVSVNGRFDRDGDVYVTPGYAAAAAGDRVELSVQGGIGAVRIERVR